MHEIAGKKMHTFLSLFAVAENSAQFFNLVDGGWSCNSCMKLLENLMHNFLSLFAVVGNGIQFYEIFFRGGSCNSCMKLLEKKVRMVRHFILLLLLFSFVAPSPTLHATVHISLD